MRLMLVRPTSVRLALVAGLCALLPAGGALRAAEAVPAQAQEAPRVLPTPPEAPAPSPGFPKLPDLPKGHPRVPPGQGAEAPAPRRAEVPEATIDDLFAKLKTTTETDRAQLIARTIEGRWLASGSDTVDLLMSRVLSAMKANNAALAQDLLDAVLTLKPDYAEAWNKRATVHFARKDFGRSIADVEQTLRLEPRHFNAMLGLAGMLKNLDRKKEALAIYRRVLDLYPAHADAAKELKSLTQDVEGREL